VDLGILFASFLKYIAFKTFSTACYKICIKNFNFSY